MFKILISISMVMASILAVSGCASSSKDPVSSTPSQPTHLTYCQSAKGFEWVLKGSGAFPADTGKAFYGVGNADWEDTQLKKVTADNMANTEIAKIFELYIAGLSKEYLAGTRKDGKSTEEKDVANVKKIFFEQTLRGSVIVDRCQDNDKKNTLYSLAKLDLNAIENSIQNANNLSEKMKEYVQKNSQKLYDELDKEVGKKRERANKSATE